MIRLLWTASAEVRYFLRCYMPSNILLDLIRTRKGLKWGVPAMLLAGPYLAINGIRTALAEQDTGKLERHVDFPALRVSLKAQVEDSLARRAGSDVQVGFAFWCTTLIENGGPGWLHLVVLVCLWNALKMIAIGPVSVVLLVRARAREYREQRQQRQGLSEDVPLGELTRSSR